MSARWTRAPTSTLCGRCNAVIPDGAAVLEIALAGIRRRLLRCEVCAGPAPPDLPPPVVPATIAERVAALRQVGTLAPARTRGALKSFAHADTWTPHRND